MRFEIRSEIFWIKLNGFSEDSLHFSEIIEEN
jgi:hypothetical protein